MKKVYVLMLGERYEGGTVQRVYESKKGAVAGARKLMRRMLSTKEMHWNESELNTRWTNGYDEVYIEVVAVSK